MGERNSDRMYRGRPAGVVPINVTLDRDAAVLLRQIAPTAKGHGRFLSRLIFEFAERQRILGKVTRALADEG